MRLPLFWSIRVHNFISKDLLTRNYKRQFLCVNSLMLDLQVSCLPVEVDAQVPPVLSDVLERLLRSDSILSYRQVIYPLLLFAIDTNNKASNF